MSKRNLIVGILVLIFCAGVVWIFLIYRANRTIDQWKSDDWQAREQATKNLNKLGKPAVGPLITALKDEDADIRWRAAYELGEIKDSRAIEPLTQALKDEDRRVRYRATEALEKIGDKRAVEPLNSSLKDEDLYVQLKVTESLKTIAGEDFSEWHGQKWWEQNEWLMQKWSEKEKLSEQNRNKSTLQE